MSIRNTVKLATNRNRSRSPVIHQVKSKRLFISNIPFNATVNDIRDLFKEKIGICGILEFIEKNGKFTGNAIMEFKTVEGAQKAVDNVHKHNINGRELIVREETLKDRERFNLNNQSQEILPRIQSQGSLAQLANDIERDGPITSSVFVSNLDYNMSWQEIKDLFKASGRVRHVDLKTDADGKSRGFCIVEFETAEEAVLAIHLYNNKMVNNRAIRLRMDKSGKASSDRLDLSKYVENNNSNFQTNNQNPQMQRLFEDILLASSNPSRQNPQTLKALDELLSLAAMFQKPMIPQQIIQNQVPIDRNLGITTNPTRGWNEMTGRNIMNDNFSMGQNFETPYFNGRGPMVNVPQSGGYNEFVSKPRDYPPGSSSRDIVDYSEVGSRTVTYGSGATSSNIVNNPVQCNIAMLEDMLFKMKNSGQIDQSSLMNVITNVMKRPNEPSFLAPSGNSFGNQRAPENFFAGHSSATLLVKNIPFSYTWKDLKISFSQISGIEQIEILRDDFNRSKGIGVIRFETYADALCCKNLMDGTLLDGRPIHIEVNNSF